MRSILQFLFLNREFIDLLFHFINLQVGAVEFVGVDFQQFLQVIYFLVERKLSIPFLLHFLFQYRNLRLTEFQLIFYFFAILATFFIAVFELLIVFFQFCYLIYVLFQLLLVSTVVIGIGRCGFELFCLEPVPSKLIVLAYVIRVLHQIRVHIRNPAEIGVVAINALIIFIFVPIINVLLVHQRIEGGAWHSCYSVGFLLKLNQLIFKCQQHWLGFLAIWFGCLRVNAQQGCSARVIAWRFYIGV